MQNKFDNLTPFQKKTIKRSDKVETTFLNLISKIFQDLIMEDETMISVSKIKLNPSLTFLDITVSAYGKSSIESVLEFLNDKKSLIRNICAKSVNLKYTPEIRFHADKSVQDTIFFGSL